jgi:uncharacterized protein YcnI
VKKLVATAVALAALAAPASAFAHAELSPPIGLKGKLELYTLAVPTEKENATTNKIELTPPQGFAIDSFVPSPGWKRSVQQTGSGEDAVITKVTWDGGKVPTGEATAFSFLASPDSAKTYTFGVRQTYSDGSVVDWSGPESSDAPAPTLEAKDSLGGGGSSVVSWIALAVAVLAAVLAAVALAAGSGRRTLA